MIKHIDIVSIPVADQTVAKQFYVELLGFDVLRENPMGPSQTWVQLGLNGAQTSITLVTWFDAMPPGSVQGVVLTTDDIAETHKELSDKGLVINDIDVTPWGKFATFSDPDGNGWVLQESS